MLFAKDTTIPLNGIERINGKYIFLFPFYVLNVLKSEYGIVYGHCGSNERSNFESKTSFMSFKYLIRVLLGLGCLQD